MSRYKFRHIWIGVYGVNIYWVVCDRANYEKLAKSEFGESPPKLKDGRFEVYVKAKEEICVIWLKKGKANHPELCHEAFHAAHWILQRAGCWLTDSSEEAYAYLIQYIFKEIAKKK